MAICDLLRYSFLASALALSLASCQSLKPVAFSDGRPVFAPDRFFTGRTHSSGVLENRSGNPTRKVTTDTNGHWQGHVLLLEQDLAYSNGEKQHRSWQIQRIDEHHFKAAANDMVGTAYGEAYGNVFHWTFTLALKPGNPLANIRMSQWMYLQPDGRSMINHTTITKAGIFLAQVTEEFRKTAP